MGLLGPEGADGDGEAEEKEPGEGAVVEQQTGHANDGEAEFDAGAGLLGGKVGPIAGQGLRVQFEASADTHQPQIPFAHLLNRLQ